MKIENIHLFLLPLLYEEGIKGRLLIELKYNIIKSFNIEVISI